MNNYTDSFIDYRNVKLVVNWTQKLCNNHTRKHPEIKDQPHTSYLISSTLSNPSLVIEGKKLDGREFLVCYYKEHKRNRNKVYYTKVVVGCNKRPLYVKTVFVRWALCDIAVQEKKYSFKEIFRDPKTSL